MSSADTRTGLEAVPVTPAERRWDFSRDAVTPGRLTAWGAELACASVLISS